LTDPARPGTPSAAADAACPCDTGLRYAACCGRWHAGPQQHQAPDAAALMRSRYSAYVLGLVPYLEATWHPSTRPAALTLEPGLRWLGLQVRAHHSAGADSATVEFVARSKLGGRAHRLHETSRFVREGGHWLYVDGDLHDR
jgi:SEC-C motif-containing protein